LNKIFVLIPKQLIVDSIKETMKHVNKNTIFYVNINQGMREKEEKKRDREKGDKEKKREREEIEEPKK
jgi:hypothetical protein